MRFPLFNFNGKHDCIKLGQSGFNSLTIPILPLIMMSETISGSNFLLARRLRVSKSKVSELRIWEMKDERRHSGCIKSKFVAGCKCLVIQ